MNCKPGDLAIVVRCKNFPQDIGLLVVCKEVSEFFPDEWIVEHAPIGKQRWTWTVRPDSCLRPIRDNPGADESLTWAPVPATKQTEPA